MQPPATTPTDIAAPAPRAARSRLDAIDVVRGAVMVTMALDHARDFTMASTAPRATDLAATTVALFLTRWITHFCAPVFVLLAGTSAALARATRPPPVLARFLVTRGLWLIFLELTLVRLGWLLNVSYRFSMLQVIWAIGASMVLLAPFAYAPPVVAGVFGVALVVLHDLWDRVHADRLGAWAWLWRLVHEPGALHPAHGATVYVAYPLVPWVGVMAAGYALGCSLPTDTRARRRLFAWLGAGLTAGFILVRAVDRYGDPHAWVAQPRGAVYTALSFLNCAKYPPSLDYLLMTLGPALLATAALEGHTGGRLAGWLRTFGRVPLFYYLIHLFVLQAFAYAATTPGLVHRALVGAGAFSADGLPATYVVWACAVLALYPVCRAYAGYKQRSRSPWLSYL